MSNFDRLAYVRAGQMYQAANVAAKSVVAVAAAMTGVILYNPVSSSKTLYIVDIGWAWTTAPAAVNNIGWAQMAPNPTVLTGLTAIGSGVLSAGGFGNAGSAVGIAYDAATLPVAPVIRQMLFGAAWGSAVGVSPHMLYSQIDGAFALPPGSVGCLAAVTTTAVGLGSLSWVEL